MLEDLTPDHPVPPSPPVATAASAEPDPVPPPASLGTAAPSEPAGEPALEPALDVADEALLDWKQALREDFEQWLESLDEIPEPEPADESPEAAPDLYSFYEQFAAANAETRKAHRRTVEALSQWGDTLARFEANLTPLRETVTHLASTQAPEGRLSRAHCLVLVEWLDRLRRVGRAFDSPPPRRGWWASDAPWRKAWQAQHQALGIVLSHLEEFLGREGVTRIETLGERFDPTTMTAVVAESDPARPAQTVLEELAPGYRRHGELLRPAQVKVSRNP